MKFSSATVALALGGSAMAAGGADNVNAVLTSIADGLKKFDTAINAWSGGPIDSLSTASKQIQSDTDSGASKIASGDALSLVDAAGITANVQGLQGQLDTTLRDLQGIGDKLAAGGHCGEIQDQLKSQSGSAQSLQDAITSKTPPEAKAIAQQLGGTIGASIKSTQEFFAGKCAGAPAGPSGGASSSSSSSSSGAGSSGSSSSPSGPGAGAGASSPKPNQAGGHPSGATHAKPATTSASVKPATYTGAGSTVQVPFAVALALAVFAL